MQQGAHLVAIEIVDRVMQMALRVVVGAPRQRVVDAAGPALLLEDGEDDLLVGCRLLELLDELRAYPQFPEDAVPEGHL